MPEEGTSFNIHEMKRVLTKNAGKIGSCFSKNKKIGTMLAQFKIESSGSVIKQDFKGQNFQLNKKNKECLTIILKEMKFPALKNGGSVEVRQFFNFIPRKKKPS